MAQSQTSSDSAAQSQSSDDGLQEITVTAQKGHYYSLDIPLCFCSQTDAFDAFRNFSAPGAPYAQNGSRKVVLAGGNPILQTVDPDAMTITNTTLPGHFFGGQVQISFYTSNGVTGAYIVGSGFGPNSELNQILGPAIFTGLGMATYYYLNPNAVPPL